MRSVVVDANVFVSLLTGRHEKQREIAAVLLQKAEDGDVAVILPQFVVFEVTYVLQSLYDVIGDRLSSMIRDLLSFPGVQVTHDCPWSRIFDLWPNPLPGLADASIAALALANRYDAIATFDQKLARRAKNLGVPSYW
ncbi:MAG TPA: PIN domain-containing protein [Thermoanaerobaculia bacterium]|nr:PIN domain-containing protein [Thermoanaerobaculia bacterium]